MCLGLFVLAVSFLKLALPICCAHVSGLVLVSGPVHVSGLLFVPGPCVCVLLNVFCLVKSSTC